MTMVMMMIWNLKKFGTILDSAPPPTADHDNYHGDDDDKHLEKFGTILDSALQIMIMVMMLAMIMTMVMIMIWNLKKFGTILDSTSLPTADHDDDHDGHDDDHSDDHDDDPDMKPGKVWYNPGQRPATNSRSRW